MIYQLLLASFPRLCGLKPQWEASLVSEPSCCYEVCFNPNHNILTLTEWFSVTKLYQHVMKKRKVKKQNTKIQTRVCCLTSLRCMPGHPSGLCRYCAASEWASALKEDLNHVSSYSVSASCDWVETTHLEITVWALWATHMLVMECVLSQHAVCACTRENGNMNISHIMYVILQKQPCLVQHREHRVLDYSAYISSYFRNTLFITAVVKAPSLYMHVYECVNHSTLSHNTDVPVK